MLYCVRCGAGYSNDAKFCGNCGAAIPFVDALGGIDAGTSSDRNRQPKIQAEPIENAGAEPPWTKNGRRPEKKTSLLVKLVSTVVLLVVAVFALAALLNSDDEKIKNRLDTYAAAYTAGDFDKMVDCFDPKTKNTMKAIAGIGSALIGIDVKDLFGAVMGIGPSVMSEDTTITITVHNIDHKSKTSAEVIISLNFAGTQTDGKLEMMKTGNSLFGEWYIDLSKEKLF